MIPSNEDLDEMSRALTKSSQASEEGLDFYQLSPDHRAVVMRLCLDADRNQLIDNIAASLEPVEQWFKISRVWDGFQ